MGVPGPTLQLLSGVGKCDYPVAYNSIYFYNFPGCLNQYMLIINYISIQ